MNHGLLMEDICCYCGEETGFKNGYEIWETFDRRYAHKWCADQYNNENKPKEMLIREKIDRLEGKIRRLDKEKEKFANEINELKSLLFKIKE